MNQEDKEDRRGGPSEECLLPVTITQPAPSLPLVFTAANAAATRKKVLSHIYLAEVEFDPFDPRKNDLIRMYSCNAGHAGPNTWSQALEDVRMGVVNAERVLTNQLSHAPEKDWESLCHAWWTEMIIEAGKLLGNKTLSLLQLS